MSLTPCEQAIPNLGATWSDLSATIRCCWTSAHPRLEIRSITISGARALDKSIIIGNGGEIPINEAFVPFGVGVHWAVILFISDVTDTHMEGLTIVAEFKDPAGRGLRRTICAGSKAAANRAVQLSGMVNAPERDNA